MPVQFVEPGNLSLTDELLLIDSTSKEIRINNELKFSDKQANIPVAISDALLITDPSLDIRAFNIYLSDSIQVGEIEQTVAKRIIFLYSFIKSDDSEPVLKDIL